MAPTFRLLLIAVLLGQAVRWVAMGLVPFADTSEPRYAEIARLMAVTGDWITPWFEPGVPFWGKPPLSFWAQALAIRAFGLGEFSARLPGWMAMAAVAWLTYRFGQRAFGEAAARWAVVVFATMLLPFVSAGAVLTDPFLALGVTWSLVSFHAAAQGPSRRWGYGFFAGLAVGLLAKGPLALVLVGGVVVGWTVWHTPAWRVWRNLPWAGGVLLLAALTVPWYVLAELKTPGFLHYFLVGEHVLRFIDPGWAGDLYGSAHERPLGAIWPDGLLAGLPWSAVGALWLAVALVRPTLRVRMLASMREGPIRFLALWALASAGLFTLSSNILWTYVLPSCGAVALLIGQALAQARSGWTRRVAGGVALVVPLVFVALTAVSLATPTYFKTEKHLVQAALDPSQSSAPLYVVARLPFSARYYSQGTAHSVDLRSVAALLRGRNAPVMIAARHEDVIDLREGVGELPMEMVMKSRRYTLYRVGPDQPRASAR